MLLSAFTLCSTTEGAAAPGPEAEWLPAVVPGGVHESLLAAGVIEHPYFAENELDVRWVEDRTWWYRTAFAGPADLGPEERLRLSLDGLDGVATAWLNGTELGTHRNQHRPAVFDVTDLVTGDDELLVRFAPTLEGLLAPGEAEAGVAALHARLLAINPNNPAPSVEATALRLARPRRRKAGFSWGWDFAPRIPSVGLQSGVRLLRERCAVIVGTHVRTTSLDLDAGTATLAVTVEVDAFGGTPTDLRVTVTGPDGRVQAQQLPAADRVEAVVDLDRVQPWWTHDLGDQPRYVVQVELLRDGEVLDTRTDRVGVRTVALDQSPDPLGGRLFRLLLNGFPLFARGANWVPPSMLVGSVADQRHRELVSTAVRGEMNVLRMWGGGIYEPDVFYDTCDELGVLVWQDFMFACDDYPSDDPELTAEVALEAAHQVRRLRNHASLGVWAGNNEVQIIHQLAHKSTEPGNWGWSWFHELLPEVVERESPGAVYRPSSPWGEPLNGVLDGDRHAWEVWHGADLGVGTGDDWASRGEAVHFHRYALDTGKFISEFGIHASPELGTLQRWTRPGTLALRSAAFDHRNKDNPKDKGYALMEHECGLPTSLAGYVELSMACQAEGLKLGVEHYRRRQPHCSGTLVWQLNDPWPGISWSVVDHDLVPKAAYYYLQRAYRPVVASFRATDDALELWVTNSSRQPVELDLLVEVAGFDGSLALRETIEVRADASSSAAVWSGERPAADQYAWVSSPSGAVEPNRAFFAHLKELPLGGASLKTQASWTGTTTAEVSLTAQGYSYFTRVLTPQPGVVLDSNYLDLRDGETRVLRVSGLPEGFDLETLEVQTYGVR